jgi:hypothetical protein
MSNRAERRRLAKAQGKPTPPGGGPHEPCLGGSVHRKIAKDLTSGVDIVVCIHSATRVFLTVANPTSGPTQFAQQDAFKVRDEAIREARGMGLLKEN